MLAPCYFKGLHHVSECDANPFLCPTLVLSHSCPTKLSLRVIHQRLFSSIYTHVAALAASFFHVGRDRREASDVMPVLSLSFPLPPFLRISGNSNGHQSEPVAPAGGPRYFPETEFIGVVWGALRLRSGWWENSENLKIVLLARVLAALSILATLPVLIYLHLWALFHSRAVLSVQPKLSGLHDPTALLSVMHVWAALPVVLVMSYGHWIVSRAARKSEQRALSLRLVESQGSSVRAYPISLCRQYVVVPPIYKMRHGMRKLLGSASSDRQGNYSFEISHGEQRALFSYQMEAQHG